MKKFFTLVSVLSLLFVSFNTTSCKDDDDDDNGNKQEMKDAASQGDADGKEFASLYNEAKSAGFTSATGISNIAKMFTCGAKYRNSDNKAYKAAYLAAATGATGLAESTVTGLLGADSIDAITNLISTLTK